MPDQTLACVSRHADGTPCQEQDPRHTVHHAHDRNGANCRRWVDSGDTETRIPAVCDWLLMLHEVEQRPIERRGNESAAKVKATREPRGGRKHLAKRWWGPNGLTIKCTCGQWQSTSGSRREQDEAHRNHRWTMGEPVKPGQPSRVEQLTAENTALLAEIDGAAAKLKARREARFERLVAAAIEDPSNPVLRAAVERHRAVARRRAEAPAPVTRDAAPSPCPIGGCDWDAEGTLDDHLYCDHEAEDLAAAVVRFALENDQLRAVVHQVQGLCVEYAEAEGRGLAPRGSHFAHWVRTAVSEPTTTTED